MLDGVSPRQWLPWVGGVLATFLVAHSANADRVVLVGGTVLEGKVTRTDDRVTVETATGTVSLPAESIMGVEPSESPIERYEDRHAALGPRDVGGRIALANYCRDHGLDRHERRLLQEVIERSPDHAVARARLGYVWSESGWVTRAEAMRKKGFVFHEGRWIPRGEAEQRVAAQALAREAKRLEEARRELLLEEARRDAERIREEARREREKAAREREALERRERIAAGAFVSPLVYYPFAITPPRVVSPRSPRAPSKRRDRAFRSAPPSDTSLSVVKVPYTRSAVPRRR